MLGNENKSLFQCISRDSCSLENLLPIHMQPRVAWGGFVGIPPPLCLAYGHHEPKDNGLIWDCRLQHRQLTLYTDMAMLLWEWINGFVENITGFLLPKRGNTKEEKNRKAFTGWSLLPYTFLIKSQYAWTNYVGYIRLQAINFVHQG